MTTGWKCVVVHDPDQYTEDGMELPYGDEPGAWWTVPEVGNTARYAAVYWAEGLLPIDADPEAKLVEVEGQEEMDLPRELGRKCFRRQRILRVVPWGDAPAGMAAAVLIRRWRMLTPEERESLMLRLESRDAYWVLNWSVRANYKLAPNDYSVLASHLNSEDAAHLAAGEVASDLRDLLIRRIRNGKDARLVLDQQIASLTGHQILRLAALL